MDSSTQLRQSASVSSRLSSIDVSQLDKINAIPNKSTNNVLMDGLCQEDQLYLDALMDEDSLDEDEDTPNLTDHGGSPWSPPMAGRPMMNSKRIKRIKPAYTITLSLEDISYIRPSWGISKGIKRIELNKDGKKKKKDKNKKTAQIGSGGGRAARGPNNSNHKTRSSEKSGTSNSQQAVKETAASKKSPLLNTYYVSLAILVLILISLMVLSYFVDVRRRHEKMYRFRLDFVPLERSFKIMKLEDGVLLENRAFKVKYGRGIPRNLKHEECSCEMYEAENRRHHHNDQFKKQAFSSSFYDTTDYDLDPANKGGDCFACFDWSHRANLQVLVNSSTLGGSNRQDGLDTTIGQPSLIPLDEDNSITCYDVKWQSYDTLRTPLVDCFHINEGDQWFGLGDIQNSIWPLNKFNQPEPTPLVSNLSSEFGFSSHLPLSFGSGGEGDSGFTANIATTTSTDQTKPEQQQQSSQDPSNNAGQKSAPASEMLNFGSHVQLELLTSSGFFVGNLRTDFRPSIKVSAARREVCLSVSCTERCTRTWSRPDDLDRFRYRNNFLEYSICSASNLRVLVSQLVSVRSKQAYWPVGGQSGTKWPGIGLPQPPQLARHYHQQPSVAAEARDQSSSLIERQEFSGGVGATSGPVGAAESQLQQQQREQRLVVGGGGSSQAVPMAPVNLPNTGTSFVTPPHGHQTMQPQQQQQQQLPPLAMPPKRQLDGLGLIERILFVTSPEYIELLDGQTLRQHVDKIVKLNLKISPILVLDTRWQLYLGSFRINSAYFPKAKLLFEILHNKGFKLVLTIKPYIDASIGVASLNQLIEAKRIVTAQYRDNLNLFDNLNNNNYNNNNGRDDLRSISGNQLAERSYVLRRQSFFRLKNETILITKREHHSKAPYLFKCKESHSGHCALIDLVDARNRLWLIDLIKRSNFLIHEADGIQLAGTHPIASDWDESYRNASAELVDRLYYKEGLFVMPQWTGNFNYIQLAPRRRDWNGLRTTVSSVLTLSMLGFSLVHPGSVWGDLRADSGSVLADGNSEALGASATNAGAGGQQQVPQPAPLPVGGGVASSPLYASVPSKLIASKMSEASSNLLDDDEDEQRRADEELIIRWLQVSVFLPILQFNDLNPIDKYNLHDQLQNLVRLRKLFIVPEIKRHLPPTPLLHLNSSSLHADPAARARLAPGPGAPQLPALRMTWSNVVLAGVSGNSGSGGGGGSGGGSGSGGSQQSSQQQQESQEAEAVSQQFMIGPDILVAPVLNAGQRQKDIYLPAGIWHDELRQTNVRGGKWLRNYPIELNEVAWFTRARR